MNQRPDNDESLVALLTRGFTGIHDQLRERDEKVGHLSDVETQKIVYATPGAESVFGYVTDEMVGLDLIELVPDAYRPAHVGYVSGFAKHMQTRSMGKRDSVLYGKERDGKTLPVEIGLFPRQFRKRKLCLANVVRLSKEI